MISGEALLLAGISCLILIALAVWADRRFAGYDRLPRQFGFTGKATAYGPRWVIIWVLPVMFVGMLLMFAFLPGILPPENVNGDPDTGLKIASLVLPCSQIFVLWLLVRWARGQG